MAKIARSIPPQPDPQPDPADPYDIRNYQVDVAQLDKERRRLRH